MNQDKLIDDKKEIDFDSAQYDIHNESSDEQDNSEEQNENKKLKKIIKKISQAS